MSLTRPGLSQRIWYKYLMFSLMLSVILIVFRFGFAIFDRSDAESRAVDPWIATCKTSYDEAVCDSALDEHEEGCLRAARHNVTEESMEFDTKVFFECMNERNRNLRLNVPHANP